MSRARETANFDPSLLADDEVSLDKLGTSGTLDVSSATLTTSTAQKQAIVDGAGGTFSGNITVPNLIIGDGGTIGSASDTDAIAIASDGGLTFSGGIDNAGTISAGTIGGSVAFPTTVTDRTDFYHSVKAIQSGTTFAPENYGQYAVAGNTENNYAVCSGVAPTGYTSIVDMYWWFITTNGGTQTYQAEFAWSIAGDGENYEVHNRGDTSFFTGASYAQNTMVKKSLMNNGSPTFESTIASGDAFGLKIKHNTNKSIVSLGVSITWRF